MIELVLLNEWIFVGKRNGEQMKLSISNIGWDEKNDIVVYDMMRSHNFQGVEIAPTRIFPKTPYQYIDMARTWSANLETIYGFTIPSMQSIWYGRQERIFGGSEERQILIEYTKKAIDFAEAIGCKNLVFGCPKNRNYERTEDINSAVEFFRTIGNYAVKKNTVIGMEANPKIYNTNYINDTVSALELIRQVNSDGFKLNLDVGTMIQNGESVQELKGQVQLINHVHISEPGLKPIERRQLHTDLKEILENENYSGFVSIEMGKVDDIGILENAMDYVEGIFK